MFLTFREWLREKSPGIKAVFSKLLRCFFGAIMFCLALGAWGCTPGEKGAPSREWSIEPVAASATEKPLPEQNEGPTPPPGMVWIPTGEFTMGCNERYAYANEKPAHRVRVSGFFLDIYPVTNRQFAEFVAATGYVTVAERPVDWEAIKQQLPPGTPRPADEQLGPGSLVFVPTEGPVDLTDMSQWWKWTLGANWRHPEGPGSDIEGREDHPVVHVAHDDALAYAAWVGKRLPTEAEWEYAARGGLEGARYAWGSEERPRGEWRVNRWDGHFPYNNSGEDGFVGTSPVGSYPPNRFGLYDMGGNVWNWCADEYAADTFAARANIEHLCCDPLALPPGAGRKWIPGDPSPPTAPGVLRRVIKGGSFLCHPDYCESYRPAARRGLPPDTATSHVGFRCALSPAPTSANE